MLHCNPTRLRANMFHECIAANIFAAISIDSVLQCNGTYDSASHQRTTIMAVISLELNELNFHYVEKFVELGKLPAFANLLSSNQIYETVSESGYPYLEPWIQWPTVYTGKTYAEHGVFRLGDSVTKENRQIWEELESQGLKVGAVSPMNAANRCVNPDFFLPDPWTNTAVTATDRTAKLYALVRDIVNDNASSDLSTIGLGRQILPLAFPYLRGKSLARYFRILPMAIKHKWAKAAFLDSLLADLFLSLVEDNGTQYGSLFLNAGAHIQHHHMYDSAVYDGERSNPTWYSSAAGRDVDPLFFIYDIYDGIISQFISTGHRILITTGLSQIPNEREHYQYRIVNFDEFFAAVGLSSVTIKPRMSRDFLLEFPNSGEAQEAIATLNTIQCQGRPLFTIEDRGAALFCQVGYFGAPDGLAQVEIGDVVQDFRSKLTLVSIENGIHQTKGYHVDTAIKTSGQKLRIPLTEVNQRLHRAAMDHRKSVSQQPMVPA